MAGSRLRSILGDRATAVAAVVFALLLVACLAAPLYAADVAETTPEANHLTDQVAIDGKPTNVVSLTGVPIGPTWQQQFLLGADENGRDLMVRLLYGGRTSLLIAAGAVALTLLLAIPLALAAGYFGGRVDSLVSRLLDLIWSFPALLLAVLLGTALSVTGAEIGPFRIAGGSPLIPIFVIGLVYVPYVARPLRGQVLSLRRQPFVEAARSAGFGDARVMASELLPHLWSTVLVLAVLSLVNAVILESALSFLGAGVDPPDPSIGTLIAGGLDTIVLSPHLQLVPCAALVVLVLSLSVLAEGLRRTLDPRGFFAVDRGRGQ